jgi:PKD repeat protein
VTVSSLEGYAGTPTVTFPGLPPGITVSPAVLSVPMVPPSRVLSFTVNAAPGTPAGPATVQVLVSDPGGLSTAVAFVANVLPGDFTPLVAPGGIFLNAGGAAGSLGVSLLPGACAPSADIVVTPSGLPPGVTVEPASAVLSPPAFAAAAFTFKAASSAAPGTTTVTFTFAPAGGGSSKVATAPLTVCGPPAAPVSPVVKPKGNPNGPVTATDYLDLSWGAPQAGFSATRYEWRINAGAWTGVPATSASAPPRGAVDPVQLFVRAYACDPEKGPGAEAASPVYSLAPPVANFSFPTPVLAGTPVTFTDTSSPQATSWLWFPGDGMAATTVQSPTVTFPSTGPKVVVLVATNGSGTSKKTVTVNVLPASASVASPGVALRAMDRQRDGRLALGRVEVEPGTTLVLRRLGGEGEAVAFLRLLDAEGNVVVERRLVLAEGEVARHDLSAWGARGALRAEVVGPEGLEAVVEERAIPYGGPEEPVRPGPVLLK